MEKGLNKIAAFSYAEIDAEKIEPGECIDDKHYFFWVKEPREEGVLSSSANNEEELVSHDYITVTSTQDKIIVNDVMVNGWENFKYLEEDGEVIKGLNENIINKEYTIKEKDNKKYLRCRIKKVYRTNGVERFYLVDKKNSKWKKTSGDEIWKEEFVKEEFSPISDNYKLIDGIYGLEFKELNKTK